MKGAAETDDLLKIRVQLMKPVTWIPLIWGMWVVVALWCARGASVSLVERLRGEHGVGGPAGLLGRAARLHV
jgi:hypothetical protein